MRHHPRQTIAPSSARPAINLTQQAQQAHRMNDLQRAESLYRAVLRTSPRDLGALAGLATLCHQTGRHGEAVDFFGQAVKLNPRAADLLANLGVVLLAAGRAKESLARCDEALALLPRHPALHDNRGNALRSLGQFEDALAAHDRAIELSPDFAEAHDNRGVALEHLGRFAEALEAHGRALALRPDSPRTLHNRAAVLLRLSRPRDALISLDRALALSPKFPEALHNRGVALLKLRRPAEALEAVDQALAIKPDYRQALRSRGMVLVELHRPEEALVACEALLASDDSALQVRAAALMEMNRPEDAIKELEQAVSGDDDPATVWTLRAQALHKLGQFDEALSCYRKALEVEPNNPVCQWNLSNIELTQGNLVDGWRWYEARWAMDGLVPPVDRPPWLGEGKLTGKTILLHCEQGYGDTIQFSRYVPLLVAKGAKVILRVQPALRDLMSSLPGVSCVVDTDQPLPVSDLYCPVASLPLAMGTTLKSIPAEVPYLAADPDSMSRWSKKLGERTLPRVGFVVSGNPQHRNDRNRSMPLVLMEPLLQLNAEFVLVQQAIDERDRAILERHRELRFFGPELKSFSDTAALLSQIDLLISVDTSVAHLAGALGKTTWIMLPLTPDWRWLLNREDSPWYPTARLFRQMERGDWPWVVNGVRDALEAYLRIISS